jgi:hypothetical protein
MGSCLSAEAAILNFRRGLYSNLAVGAPLSERLPVSGTDQDARLPNWGLRSPASALEIKRIFRFVDMFTNKRDHVLRTVNARES